MSSQISWHRESNGVYFPDCRDDMKIVPRSGRFVLCQRGEDVVFRGTLAACQKAAREIHEKEVADSEWVCDDWTRTQEGYDSACTCLPEIQAASVRGPGKCVCGSGLEAIDCGVNSPLFLCDECIDNYADAITPASA